ncbi:hypothetical protein BaRGS_00006520 [Batillaria attramentaria]|uniref:Uncharacterized protein n=1 Tax=Batillaria attramentaria TaxID=370345 RepID=A0ABD0LSM6_9CAEN
MTEDNASVNQATDTSHLLAQLSQTLQNRPLGTQSVDNVHHDDTKICGAASDREPSSSLTSLTTSCDITLRRATKYAARGQVGRPASL